MPHRFAPRRLAPGLSLALCALSGAVHAAPPPMRAGLWEVNMLGREVNGKAMPDMSGAMAGMMDKMAKMPPEMRAKIEAQMKSQGVQMGAPGSTPGGMRVCISQDMINSNRWQQHEGRCQNTGASQSGDTWTVKFSCQDPETTGEVRTTFQGGNAYTSEMSANTVRMGKPTQMRMRSQAKWLGADCGDIKPVNMSAGAPPAKP